MKNTILTALTAAFILLMLCLSYIVCNRSEIPNSSTDSTSIWKLQAKQAGNAAAIYISEVSRLQTKLMELRTQLDKVKSHENKLKATNISLIAKLRQTAPKTCEPYIDSTVTYYNEILDVKDSSYASLMGVLLVTDSASLVKDSLIIQLGVQVDKQGKIIDEIERAKDIAKVKAKRSRIATKVIGFSAAILVVLSWSWAGVK